MFKDIINIKENGFIFRIFGKKTSKKIFECQKWNST